VGCLHRSQGSLERGNRGRVALGVAPSGELSVVTDVALIGLHHRHRDEHPSLSVIAGLAPPSMLAATGSLSPA
jgi:hypothetical protein